MSALSHSNISTSSTAPQGEAAMRLPPPEEVSFFMDVAFWEDAEGKRQRAYEADYRARWAAQQAREAREEQARLDAEAASSTPEPHPHKVHPAGRGWIDLVRVRFGR
ncbi:hypothetical protein SZ64_07280 [Erythrobacter sp. SG61-1L]|uniref:hypothetical protein n=1 Tax=Erythrobacter sp. SG61-1L TaxID=1603897 RepID=UPI0006C8FFE5|nr:hypothetical protein [Erythrobacter sp. SG61-1L]KPL67937.1 hypothetical protein SZ64_07280 [Erythrobacter sp. SG61-1L]